MDAPTENFGRCESPNNRSEVSTPNSNASLNLSSEMNLTSAEINQEMTHLNSPDLNNLSVRQSDAFHRMFFQQQMHHLGQMSLDVMKRMSTGGTAVTSGMQGPRHTIDAILGLNGTRRPEVQDFECGSPRDTSVSRSLTPGAGESAGE